MQAGAYLLRMSTPQQPAPSAPSAKLSPPFRHIDYSLKQKATPNMQSPICSARSCECLTLWRIVLAVRGVSN